MLDPLQFYCRVLCNGMKMRFRMVMIAHPGPGIGFHKRFMWRIIILPTPWQSERQRRTLSPLHHHMLTPPGYPTAPSHTRNPSDVERDSISRLPHDCHTWLTNAAYHHETAQDAS